MSARALGTGCGIAGMFCARLGAASVTVTVSAQDCAVASAEAVSHDTTSLAY